MAEEDMIKAETQKLLRSEERHSRLFGRSVAFTLVTLYASSDEVRRRAFAPLGARKDMVQRQVFGMTVVTAILTSIAVANVYPRPLHRRFTSVPANMYVVPQP